MWECLAYLVGEKRTYDGREVVNGLPSLVW